MLQRLTGERSLGIGERLWEKAMQGIGRRWIGLPIALFLGWIIALAVEAPATMRSEIVGPWSVCDQPPWLSSAICIPAPLRDVDPQGRLVWLTSEVRLDRGSDEPAGVFVSAYASSAVYWDRTLIGTNGAASERPALERPGRRDAAFPIPGSTSGAHRLTLRMSSHHGLLRLRSPVTEVSIAPFERSSSRVMRDYLPALVSAGGLLVMVLISALASWGGQRNPSGAYLLGAGLFAAGQLSAEASRAFFDFTYPLLFIRILLLLGFAVGFSVMFVAYLACRAGARIWPAATAQALLALLTILLVDGFDQRTGLVLSSSMLIGLVLSFPTATRSVSGSLPLVAMLALGLVASLVAPHSFLNRELYLWTAGLFILLFVEEAWYSRRDRLASQGQLAPSSQKPAVPVGLHLGTAAGRHFVLPSDIVRLAAADDYTEVFLIDGRAVLHPEPLQKLMERLPATFIRVHRSHAINLLHLRSFRKGRTSAVVLSDDSTAPVSRRSVSNLMAVLEG